MEEKTTNQKETAASSKVNNLFSQLENLAVEKINRLEATNSQLEERLAQLEAALVAQNNPTSVESTSEIKEQELVQLTIDVETFAEEAVNKDATTETDLTSVNKPNLNPKQLLNSWFETYPQTFIFDSPKPLKIGIHQDLQLAENLTEKQVKRALANYVKLPRYFNCIKAGTQRINLQGEECGEITQEEEVFAKQQLEKLASLKKVKQPSKPTEANKTKTAFNPNKKRSTKPNNKSKNSSKFQTKKAPTKAKVEKAFSNNALQEQLEKLLSK